MHKKIITFSLLFINVAYADLYTTDVPEGCNFVDNVGLVSAVFEPNQYTCSSGFYLPADYTECRICPTGVYSDDVV